MAELSRRKIAGDRLRQLIKENYRTQQDFADDYGMDLRNVSRLVNNGIKDVDIIQELADFFDVDFITFFSV